MHLAAEFPIDILEAAFAFDKLLMLTQLACDVWEEQGAAEALRAVAVGLVELVGRIHAQASRTQRHAIRSALVDGMAMLVERHGSDAAMDSAFGAYYHHLVARGLPRRAAMMAVMRKMLAVAYRLLKSQQTYDPTKVFAQLVVHSSTSEPPAAPPQMASVRA